MIVTLLITVYLLLGMCQFAFLYGVGTVSEAWSGKPWWYKLFTVVVLVVCWPYFFCLLLWTLALAYLP